MNDGSRILEKQNEKENLHYLAAQRQLYSDAKSFDAINTLLCLGVPLGVTFFQLFMDFDYRVLVGVDLLVAIAGFLLPKRVACMIRSAADLQQKFDSSVFGIKFARSVDESCEHVSHVQRYLTANYSSDDLTAWYTVSIDGLPAKKAISMCQKQNAEWSKRLLFRFLFLQIVGAACVIVLIFVMAARNGVDISRLTFWFSIFEWVFIKLYEGIRKYCSAKKLSRDVNRYQLESLDNIRRVQAVIYENRCSSFLIPDWFYKMCRNDDDRKTTNWY